MKSCIIGCKMDEEMDERYKERTQPGIQFINAKQVDNSY